MLIENTSLPDDYILNKIVEQAKRQHQAPTGDRVFIFPTLQMNVINYREDENLLLQMLEHFSKKETGL